RALMLLCAAAAAGGCSQTAQLHLARGSERSHTPAAERTTRSDSQHATAAAATKPADCDGAKIKAYNHHVCCDKVQEVVAPENLVELEKAIGSARHVRVVANSHTSNEQICTDGVGISIANFNQIHGLRHRGGVTWVDVDAGVRLSDLNRWLYDHGQSIGYSTIGFRGITIGGGLATAVHGSSLKFSSVLSARLVQIQFVDGQGHRHDFHRPPPLPPGASDAFDGERAQWRALSANVGMLGVVTRVGLEVEPRFNLDVTTDFMGDDVLWKKGVEKLVGDCDWGQLVWLPRAGKVMRMCGKHSLEEPQPGASNSLLAPHVQAGAMGAFKELMEDTIANGAYLCDIETERWRQLKKYPPFVKDCCCNKRYDAHVIGPADLMMSSELTEHQESLGEIDYEVAVPLSEAAAALARVRDYAKDKRLCMPLIGAFLRFSPLEDHTLIGHSVTDGAAFKDQKVMFLELVVYILHAPEEPHEAWKQEHEYYAKYRELALELVKYHHGRPHWAKNETPLFVEARNDDAAYRERLHQFHCFVHRFDPDNRFGNAFTAQVGLTPTQSEREKLGDCALPADE
ncbi:MAG: FAD-dependent oxidoreductase, partial [bacterium]|nr:FAD-dependent oxidoreductase [bacterium]